MSKIAFLFLDREHRRLEWDRIFMKKYPSARQVFDQASQWLSLDMKALCFEKK